MITRLTRIQIFAFVVMAAIAITFVGAKYAGLDRFFTTTTYTVELRLPESGGIFRNAEVTYQGVQVGRVGDLRPTIDGVAVDLLIEDGYRSIPAAGLQADVKNLSAVGELYVDLTATSTEGPYLSSGSIIEAPQTSTPVPPAELLSSLNSFVRSVPTDSLTTILRELDAGFGGTGPELGRLIDSSSLLVGELDQSLAQTTALIRDGQTVLRTQNDASGDIKSFSRDLRLLAGELEQADPDLRRLVTTAPQFSTEAVALLRESGPGLELLLADLRTVSQLTAPRIAPLRQLFNVYPALTRAAYTAVPGDGTAHFGLVVNAFDPLPCIQGYEGTQRRPGTDVRDIPVNAEAECTLPRGNPSTVRGSQNAPRQGVPSPVPIN